MDYWKECIQEALNECGLIATNEQISAMAKFIENSHENYSTAMGHDCIPNPLSTENNQLKQKLEREKNKKHCRKCNGTGSITTNFGVRSSTSRCHLCDGVGWIY